jgi:hybrid cluster-associated redox disulfide protein
VLAENAAALQGASRAESFTSRRIVAMSEATPVKEHFLPDMTVDAAMALHPSTRWVFAAYHLSGCTNCSSSSAETLAEVAEGYKLSLGQLLADLNSLFDTKS